ncbi:ABC transporter permease [Achromobacter aloeverae]|uniref:ABC transporter permease n=1 Tax=Achromobacter aloeverae TaxID=1750518 RepID=A0A4Q1HNK4_9BURK|nr:ABC transporter permease [Achromobacter aloeverae]RXN92377.1 ABC transporter permease [Achromobacter aloeverae]
MSAPASGRARRRPYVLIGPCWAAPALLFLAAFFVLPLGGNFLRGMGDAGAQNGPWFYYAKLFTDGYYLSILGETLRVSLVVTLACLVLGYPVAYFMVRHAGKWNGLILFCLITPLLTSVIMRTFGWQVLLSRTGLLNQWLMAAGLIARPVDMARQPIAVYIGLVHVLIPFMVLSIAAVLRGIDARLEESARVLGASRLGAFLRVTLPLSLDGVATGCILVFVLTNGSFVTMLLLGGGRVVTLPLLIYQQFNLTQDTLFASAMGNVLLVAALLCLVLQVRFIRRKGVKP